MRIPALYFTAAIACLVPGPARADLIVSVESVAVAANSTGDVFDVTLTNSGPLAVSIGGFSFEISTTAPGINFDSATIGTTTAAYIFAGHSDFGPTINTSSGSTLDASDIYNPPNSGVMLASGATVGLGQVAFDIGSNGGAVNFSIFPASSLSDPSGNDIPINQYQGGFIAVTSVPEPSSLLGLMTAMPAAALLVRRTRPARRSRSLTGR